jgi:hypothetical protein
MVWGQVAGSTSTPNTLTLLALRRWCSGLTLCSPAAVPGMFGFWSWLLGMVALLILAVVFQGPVRVWRQVFEVSGNVRLLAAAVERLRRAGRMVAVTVGATVVAWTVSQSLRFNDPQGRDDLLLLTKARSLGELALEQGALAALTPVRDLYGLGDNVVLLILVTVVLFRAMTERQDRHTYEALTAKPFPLRSQAITGGPDRPRVVTPGSLREMAAPAPRWATPIWGATALYFLYRLGTRITGTADLPVGGCSIVEALLIPFLMAVSDGVMLAWILVELRGVSMSEAGNDSLEPLAVVGLVPGAVLACLLAIPARYLATAILLGHSFAPTMAGANVLGSLFRWQLSWGLADVQGAALVTVGLAGALAWSRGSPASAVQGYLRLLTHEGGHLVVVVALAGLAAGAGAALAYVLVLSLPASTWLLAAADGYAHYATLPVGLVLLAALVELGECALPTAKPAGGADEMARLEGHDQSAA